MPQAAKAHEPTPLKITRSGIPREADATAMGFFSSSSLMAYCATSLFSWLPSGAPSARRWPFGPSADVCVRASSKVVKLGIMRSMLVIARTRRTGAAAIASSSSPPSAWARLCAASSVCSRTNRRTGSGSCRPSGSRARARLPPAGPTAAPGVGDVDLLRCRHDRHAVDHLIGEPAVMHLRHRLGPQTLLPGAPLCLLPRMAGMEWGDLIRVLLSGSVPTGGLSTETRGKSRELYAQEAWAIVTRAAAAGRS